MGVVFDRRGVLARTAKAAAEAIDETTEAAAEDARGTSMNLPPHTAAGHPWYGASPRVENAVSTQPATRERGEIRGAFGATKRRGDYAFFLERLHPYLRPAADRHFKDLARRIRERRDG